VWKVNGLKPSAGFRRLGGVRGARLASRCVAAVVPAGAESGSDQGDGPAAGESDQHPVGRGGGV
jgi:hypothetical protein